MNVIITWLFMMTSSNENIFRVTGPLCGEFTGPGEFPTQRPVTRSFDVFFDLRLNKRLSKQPWGWWFETSSWSLWRHCNVCFFPGFDRFIPGFDRFIPGFDRFIPASIPVIGPPSPPPPHPIQSKCTLVNKICIALYFDIILFYLISNKYIFN